MSRFNSKTAFYVVATSTRNMRDARRQLTLHSICRDLFVRLFTVSRDTLQNVSDVQFSGLCAHDWSCDWNGIISWPVSSDLPEINLVSTKSGLSFSSLLFPLEACQWLGGAPTGPNVCEKSPQNNRNLMTLSWHGESLLTSYQVPCRSDLGSDMNPEPRSVVLRDKNIN